MAEKVGHDVESGKPKPIPHFKQVLDQGVVTQEIIDYHYEGSGTENDPYIVGWMEPYDPRNPMRYSESKKWILVLVVAIATLAVAFVSSAYSGGVTGLIEEFGASDEVVTLGLSLFVLGFAIGPLLWAPLSELFGRQYLFIGTYAMLTIFNAGAAGSNSIGTLIVLRFFAGAFGSSPLTNAGGVIADMFPANQRGIAMSLFASAPFLGPTIGPIVGGFVGETVGWRWIEGIMAIFTGIVWIMGTFFLPETYGPVLLRQRAARLSKLSGKVYISKSEADQGKTSIGQAFKTALSRPWVLLLKEPIVLLLSIYMAIIYGTLYMLFSAFPIVYQQNRGWSAGIGGLSFLGVMVGMLLAVAYAIWDNGRYVRTANKSPGGFAPPEARLPPVMIGGVLMPIALFWFAFTNGPEIQFMVSIVAGAPFGFGMVLVFLGIMNYLIDAYVIFAASVLAANSVLRSLFGAAFPLFTTYMYDSLGIHWASALPGFLALACVPFPFIFYKYGPAIRKRCKYAAEADRFMRDIRGQSEDDETSSDEGNAEKEEEGKEASASRDGEREREEDREAEAFDYSYEDEREISGGRFQRIKTGASVKPARTHDGYYNDSPFDLDRVNTRESFKGESRRGSATSSPARSMKSKKSSKSLKSTKKGKSTTDLEGAADKE